MDGPDAAVLREVRCRLGMPVLGIDDRGAGVLCRCYLNVDGVDDVLAADHVQPARRVGEVVLHVDDQEGGLPVVVADPPRLTGCLGHRDSSYLVGIAGSPRESLSPSQGTVVSTRFRW